MKPRKNVFSFFSCSIHFQISKFIVLFSISFNHYFSLSYSSMFLFIFAIVNRILSVYKNVENNNPIIELSKSL